VWDRIKKSWRYLESLHTVEWLWTLAPAGVVTLLGGLSGVAWYWLTVVAIVLIALTLLLIQEFGLPFGVVPLPEACLIAFKKLHGTELVEVAHGFGADPEHRLDVMARTISIEAPILGKRPPSPVLETLGKQTLAQGNFVGGARHFTLYGNEAPKYVDLAIKRSDLRRGLKRLLAQLE